MPEVLIIGLLLFAFVLALLLRALVATRRQAKVMKIQSEEIKKQVLELEFQNQELQKLNQEKLQVISLVSHDLKGPFNRIFALIQLINLGKGNLTDEQMDYLGKIHQITADGLGMVRNLLDNRRLEDKGIEFKDVALDLSQLVTSLAKNYNAVAEKKKIEIELETSGQIIAKVDKLYLGRVIENLLSNAIKFSAEGKKVFVKLIRLPESIELSVSDQGPGISHDDQLKLYQRFQRLAARPTGGESSSGLGLFIVKSILEKIGADIQCDSEIRQGTCFTVRLPKKFLV